MTWHRHAEADGLRPHRHAETVAGHVHVIPFRGSTGPMVPMASCAVASAHPPQPGVPTMDLVETERQA